MHSKARCLILLLIVVSAVAVNVKPQAQIMEAQWEVHQVRFRYSGFNTYYTCDGIKRTLKRLLNILGARNDARIESTCNGDNIPLRTFKILMAFAVPVPADKTDITREIIPAELRQVRVTGARSRLLDAGDCELLEQFQRQVLPQLRMLKVKRNMHCLPYRTTYSTMNFRVTALKALKKKQLEAIHNKKQDTRPEERR